MEPRGSGPGARANHAGWGAEQGGVPLVLPPCESWLPEGTPPAPFASRSRPVRRVATGGGP